MTWFCSFLVAAAVGGQDIALAGAGDVLQLQFRHGIRRFEEVPPGARDHGVDHQGQRVEQAREEQLADERDAGTDADVATLGLLQGLHELLQGRVHEGGVRPAQRALEGSGGDVLAHRVDETPEGVPGVGDRPELRPLLVPVPPEEDGVHPIDHRSHPGAQFGVEAVELPEVG